MPSQGSNAREAPSQRAAPAQNSMLICLSSSVHTSTALRALAQCASRSSWFSALHDQELGFSMSSSAFATTVRRRTSQRELAAVSCVSVPPNWAPRQCSRRWRTSSPKRGALCAQLHCPEASEVCTRSRSVVLILVFSAAVQRRAGLAGPGRRRRPYWHPS